MKKCSTCKKIKLKIDFYKNRSRKDGLSIQCKACNAKYKKLNNGRWKQSKEYRRNYYLKNKKYISARNSRYKKLKAYRYEKLIEINRDSETISGIETRVPKKYKPYKYTPKLKFEGSTECLELIVKEKLYEQFKK